MTPGKKFLCKRCKTVVIVPGAGVALPTPAPQELAETVTVDREEDTVASGADDEGDRLLGRVIGGCQVESKLGAGGMGTVYRAIQVSLNRPVALKILSNTLSTNEEYIARFEREARAVAVLNHPNIVQVYDMGKDEEEGFYFIVMEFVDGATLSELWKEKGVLDENFALRAIRQACSGLHAAHDAGILHRDIKPENLMISKGGRVKIADFGLAKETHGDSQLTGTGIALGTPAYMAPEQGMGESPDRRSDIYSLGGTLFTLLTARLPYEAKSPLAMMMKHATDPVPLAREVNPAISEPTEEIIVQSMAKAPEKRFADMNEMRDALQSSLDALSKAPKKTVEAPPPPKKTPSPIKTRSPLRTPSPMKRSAPKKSSPTPRGRKSPPAAEPTPRTPHKAVTPAHRGARKTPAHSRSGAHRPTRHGGPSAKGGNTLLIAGGVGALAVIILLVVVVIAMGGSKGGNGDSEEIPIDSGTDTPTKSGKSGSGKGGGTGKGKSPGGGGTKDEPEGPLHPTHLPPGVGEGDEPGEYVNRKDGSVLVYVPAGRVTLGFSEEDLDWVKTWYRDLIRDDFVGSMPKRSVYLDGYFICKHEITNEQYENFLDWCEENPAEKERLHHPEMQPGNSFKPMWWGLPAFSAMAGPVVGVDWCDAHAYAKWAGMELPTEAQWEKAAHWDPRKRERRMFPWGDRPDTARAFVADRTAGRLLASPMDFSEWNRNEAGKNRDAQRPEPIEASEKDVSPVGAVGMCGNVEEWCRDPWHPYFHADPDAKERNPFNRAYYPGRVVRGGHFANPLVKFLTRTGYYNRHNARFQYTGFRCVIPLVTSKPEVSPDVGEPELKALPESVRRRTLMGLLDAMKEKGEWDSVIRQARAAIEDFPDEPNFYLRLGLAFMETGKPIDAVYHLKSGAKHGKRNEERADLHYWTGQAYWRAKDFKSAYEAFTQATDLNPTAYRANYWRGKYLLEQARDHDQALLAYEKALRYTWTGPNALHGAGRCKEQKRDYKAALKYYGAALQLSLQPNYLYSRGDLHAKMKNWAEAERDFRKLLEVRNYSLGYVGLMKMYEAKGDEKKALEMAERGLQHQNTHAAAYNDLRAGRDRLKGG
ncbi:MAG: protein kinase domain-containing protein [Planctomycetota bacterium]|jgi:serine/threonine-protein kinase